MPRRTRCWISWGEPIGKIHSAVAHTAHFFARKSDRFGRNYVAKEGDL